MPPPAPILHSPERRLLATLCLALALLQALDLHSTFRAAGAGRAETNPAIVWAISYVGFAPAVIAFKAVALAITGGYYHIAGRIGRTFLPLVPLFPVCAAYIVVVLNNYS